MQPFKVAFVNEIERMLKRKKAVVVLVLAFATIIIQQLGVAGINMGLGLRAASSANFPLLSLELMCLLILPLFTTLVVIDTFSSEFNNNTIKISYLKPVTRFKLFIAKILAYVSFVGMILVVVLILSLIVGLIFNPTVMSLNDIIKILVAYIITIIPFTVLILFIAMMGQYIKSPVGLFFLCLLMYIVLTGVAIILPSLKNMVFIFNLNWYSIFTNTPISISRLINVTCQLLGYGAIFFAAAFHSFEKRE